VYYDEVDEEDRIEEDVTMKNKSKRVKVDHSHSFQNINFIKILEDSLSPPTATSNEPPTATSNEPPTATSNVSVLSVQKILY
jgi:hypothetical protein